MVSNILSPPPTGYLLRWRGEEQHNNQQTFSFCFFPPPPPPLHGGKEVEGGKGKREDLIPFQFVQAKRRADGCCSGGGKRYSEVEVTEREIYRGNNISLTSPRDFPQKDLLKREEKSPVTRRIRGGAKKATFPAKAEQTTNSFAVNIRRKRETLRQLDSYKCAERNSLIRLGR